LKNQWLIPYTLIFLFDHSLLLCRVINSVSSTFHSEHPCRMISQMSMRWPQGYHKSHEHTMRCCYGPCDRNRNHTQRARMEESPIQQTPFPKIRNDTHSAPNMQPMVLSTMRLNTLHLRPTTPDPYIATATDQSQNQHRPRYDRLLALPRPDDVLANTAAGIPVQCHA